MAKKTSHLATKIKRERDAATDVAFNQGIRIGAQMMADCWMATLNDPDVMGRDIFGHDRMLRVGKAVDGNYDKYFKALDVAKNKEADVWQERLDEKLRKTLKDDFIPFAQRYPDIRKIKY